MLNEFKLPKKAFVCIIAVVSSLMFVNTFADEEYDGYDEEQQYYYDDDDYRYYDISVTINDEEVFFEDAKPYASSGYIYYLPLRETFEKLGYGVEWDNNSRSVIITKEGYTAQYYTDSEDMYVNGEVPDEWVLIENDNGTLMVYCRDLELVDGHLICRIDGEVISIYSFTDSELQTIINIESQIDELWEIHRDRCAEIFEKLEQVKYSLSEDYFSEDYWMEFLSNVDFSESRNAEDVAALIRSGIKEEDALKMLEFANEAEQLMYDIYTDMEKVYAQAPKGYDDFEQFYDEYYEWDGLLNKYIDFLEGRMNLNDVLKLLIEHTKEYGYW